MKMSRGFGSYFKKDCFKTVSVKNRYSRQVRFKFTSILILLPALLLISTPVNAAQPQVAAGVYYTVGLITDGTVLAVGYNNDGQCDVSLWTDIQQVATGGGGDPIALLCHLEILSACLQLPL